MTAPMNRKALIGALPLIAQTLGDKYGVKVHIGRSGTAYTDGVNIHLPQLPLENDEIEIVANGYIDHEASHIKETDFSVFALRKPAVEQHLLNILEDLRIEKRMMERYPGTKKNLTKLVRYLVEKGDGFTMPTGDPADDHPANLLVNASLMMGRCEVLEQEALNDIAAAYELRVAEVFTKGTVVKLSALLAQAIEQDNTAGCHRLAKKILKMVEDELKDASKEDANDQNSQQGDQGDQGDQDSGDSSQSGDDSDQNGDQSDDQASDGSSGAGDSGDENDSDDAEGDSGQSGQGSADGDDEEDDQGSDAGSQSGGSDDNADDQTGQSGDSDSDQDSSDATGSTPSKGAGSDNGEELLKKIKRASADDIDAKSDLGDLIADRLNKDVNEDLNMNGYDSVIREIESHKTYEPNGRLDRVTKAQVKQATVKLRARLQAKIEASLRENSYLSESGRKVCSRALPGVKTGNAKVFKHRTESRGLDTAIQILVDRSGSMGWDNNGQGVPAIGPAMESAMAVMAALEGINGVATACSVFPSCATLTGFDEPLARTAKRYELAVTGGTPLTEGLLWCIKHQLSKRREQRKIFIVITDGDPDNPMTAHQTITKMAASGIEMIGIGIGQDAEYVKTLFPVSDVIYTVKDLPQTLFKLIQAKF
ncbi:VWA domain-containing protein [Marinobacter alkaliphilus]|uniref:VWA domain-containing protein n=1 Tax=Marinobacter alkaliphilus TaxID=254719 RepID=A0ABZ3E9B8_9GAMM